MHLLVHLSTPDYAAWKADFDAHAEDRDGMTLMQLWRGADTANDVTALLDVHDRAKAEQWLANQRSLGHAVQPHFLKTA